jgi:hypothetical protein
MAPNDNASITSSALRILQQAEFLGSEPKPADTKTAVLDIGHEHKELAVNEIGPDPASIDLVKAVKASATVDPTLLPKLQPLVRDVLEPVLQKIILGHAHLGGAFADSDEVRQTFGPDVAGS